MENSNPGFSVDAFLNIQSLTEPKNIPSLQTLWDVMFAKMAPTELKSLHNTLLEESNEVVSSFGKKKGETKSENAEYLDKLIHDAKDESLYLITRELHIRNHLEQIDSEASSVFLPRSQFRKKESDLLDSQLILQSFLDHLRSRGTEDFSRFVNTSLLRLVSTVHPNETERNTNLMHYTYLEEKYIEWRKDFDSLSAVRRDAPEYRIRRETLNQLRRQIKAEIEGIWQSDQMRRDAINVQNEAKRITERYKVIFKAYPVFLKFIKHLAIEAYWRYQASIYYTNSAEWRETFLKFHIITGNREDMLKAIRRTFQHLGFNLTPPRIVLPVIEFGTWKGGDRDGNPFVVAAFTNQTFIEQKEFVLSQYVEMARLLVDKLTPSTNHIKISEALKASIQRDHRLFPYITNIKPQEPYRAKMRYILEKLENSLTRVKEVKKHSGETSKPLLGQTLPGPTGYNNFAELQSDLNILYESLARHEGKAQARSLLQDFHILVDTFKLHMTSIDFRQTAEKNKTAVKEYLTGIGHPAAATISKLNESEKVEMLVSLILSEEIELNPWAINSLSKISKDTFETFLIFADAALADPKAVGKFIISMCQNASDVLNVLLMMKICGMLVSSKDSIVQCPFDVTGLFETVDDLQKAPTIVRALLSIPIYRDYIITHRGGKMTVMMGYSDSVRDGSALTSDAQITRTSIELLAVENELNQGISGDQRISLVFYRGRGDTLPRGYGGSIEKALMSQVYTAPNEDHTEQNRYLRKYATFSSALDHLHRVYSAHLSSQLKPKHPDLTRLMKYFEFFGKISNIKWASLVREDIPGGKGKLYFQILNTYSIIPHLPRSNFASRPVARDGVHYDIDNIRAIPFTMALAQMREFTSAYYGTGTAFEVGVQILGNVKNAALVLLKEFIGLSSNLESFKRQFSRDPVHPLAKLLKHLEPEESFDSLVTFAKEAKEPMPEFPLKSIISMYASPEEGIKRISEVFLDLLVTQQNPVDILKYMYQTFVPFRYAIQNREQALIIRNKAIVDEYTKNATPEERELLNETEYEAVLTKNWILQVTGQEALEQKTMKQDFSSTELFILHKIQSHFMHLYRDVQLQVEKSSDMKTIRKLQQKLQQLNVYIQVSILAISEALGFGG